MKHSGQGFTLIELIVVIALIGILAGIAMPSFNALRKQASRREVANEVAGALMKARSRAITRNEQVQVDFDIDGSAANQNNKYTVKLTQSGTVVETKQLANGIEIRGLKECSKTSGSVSIRFNPDGTAFSSTGWYICVFSDDSVVRYSAGVSNSMTGRVITKRGAP